MDKQACKVFVGGLSWETTDEKLRRYFENYGTVQECFVSYDRHTLKPRGFGFVVFDDPIVADKVVSLQHTIDRREVEAKRAVPKEETPLPRHVAGQHQQRTKKVFVGGLAPSVDEAAFRAYFEQFGPVDDAVVMYDHDNKRPRGFGFVTFVSEESVDKVFGQGAIQTLHDKQIEIKKAVPKDQMACAAPAPRAGLPHAGAALSGAAPGRHPQHGGLAATHFGGAQFASPPRANPYPGGSGRGLGAYANLQAHGSLAALGSPGSTHHMSSTSLADGAYGAGIPARSAAAAFHNQMSSSLPASLSAQLMGSPNGSNSLLRSNSIAAQLGVLSGTMAGNLGGWQPSLGATSAGLSNSINGIHGLAAGGYGGGGINPAESYGSLASSFGWDYSGGGAASAPGNGLLARSGADDGLAGMRGLWDSCGPATSAGPTQPTTLGSSLQEQSQLLGLAHLRKDGASFSLDSSNSSSYAETPLGTYM